MTRTCWGCSPGSRSRWRGHCTVLYCTVLYCTVLYTVQVEGVAIITIVVENILKELDIDLSKVALLKVNTELSQFARYLPSSVSVQTGLCRSVNPGDVVFTRIWFSSEATEEESFTKLHFESSSQSCGKPILTGSYIQYKYGQ